MYVSVQSLFEARVERLVLAQVDPFFDPRFETTLDTRVQALVQAMIEMYLTARLAVCVLALVGALLYP